MENQYSFSPKTWLRAGLLIAGLATCSLITQAQIAPVKLWDKTFGGSNMDYIKSLKQTTDGGYILGGFTESGISGDKTQASRGGVDYWIMKLDANGNKIWDKTFGGNDHDFLTSLQQTADGGYIVGGASFSGISGDKTQTSKGSYDYWVVKLDASGNKTWDKTYGGSSYDYLNSLQQTSDGGYILGGHSESDMGGDKSQGNNSAPGYSDYWILKLDASGNKIWDKSYGGGFDDLLNSLQQTSDGGFILGGSSDSGISGDKTQTCKGVDDYWVVKVDSSGNKIWDKTFGGNSYDDLNSLQQTTDGGYILGGFSSSGIGGDKTQASQGQGSADFWVLKLDANGNKTWDKTIGGSNADALHSLQQTSDGGYILGGESSSGISGDKSQALVGLTDYWVVKIDASGNKTWDKTLGGSGDDLLYSLHQTSNGDYIMGGMSNSGISGDKSQASKGSYDFWAIKLAGNITGLKETETGFAASVYPNPSKGNIQIQLSSMSGPSISATVSDLLGRVVLQQELLATDQNITLDLTLPSAKGIYLLQLNAGEQTFSRKIVVE
jgi:hypothetical protein